MFYIKIICWSDLEIWLLCTKVDSVSTERLLPGAVLLIKQFCRKENIGHFFQSVHRLLIVWSWCSQQIQSRRSVFIYHKSYHYLNTLQHHYISHIFPRLCSLSADGVMVQVELLVLGPVVLTVLGLFLMWWCCCCWCCWCWWCWWCWCWMNWGDSSLQSTGGTIDLWLSRNSSQRLMEPRDVSPSC